MLVMVPLPDFLNAQLENDIDDCCIQLFLHQDRQPEYVANFGCTWNLATGTIRSILADKGFVFKNLWIGLVQRENTIPVNLLLIKDFFANKANGKKLMVLYCKIDNSGKNLLDS